MHDHLKTILSRCCGSKIDGCWIYTGFRNKKGYGRTTYKGRQVLVYNITYGLLIGKVKHGLELHHKCNTPACVNPYHLQQVTHRQNMIDFGTTNYCAIQAKKTHCKNGHEFTPENTYKIHHGKNRNCKKCCKQLAKRNYERRKLCTR